MKSVHFLTELLLCLGCVFLSGYVGEGAVLGLKDGGEVVGEFRGVSKSGEVLWVRKGEDDVSVFDGGSVREVDFGAGGAGVKLLCDKGFVVLRNLDVVAGEVVGLDDERVYLVTDFAGKISVARKNVRSVYFSSVAERMLFSGDVKEAEWTNEVFSSKLKEEGKSEACFDFADGEIKNTESAGFCALRRELPSLVGELGGMEGFCFKFKLNRDARSWAEVILLADKVVPEQEAEEGAKIPNYMAEWTGSCLSILLREEVELRLHYFGDGGEPLTMKVPNMMKPLKLSYTEGSKGEYAVYFNEKRSLLSLYKDGVLVSQWDVAIAKNFLKGRVVGFADRWGNEEESEFTVSDVELRVWDGAGGVVLKEEKLGVGEDMVEMEDGVSRFYGKAGAVNDAKELGFRVLRIEMSIPVDGVNVVRFSDGLAGGIRGGKSAVTVYFEGRGAVSGKVLRCDDAFIYLETVFMGEVGIRRDFLSKMRFNN